MKKKSLQFWMGFGASICAGIFILFFLTGYSIPCQQDPTDCSGRDIGMMVLTLPTSAVLLLPVNILPSSWINISVEMFVVFLSGIIQYGAIGVVVGGFIHWFLKKYVHSNK